MVSDKQEIRYCDQCGCDDRKIPSENWIGKIHELIQSIIQYDGSWSEQTTALTQCMKYLKGEQWKR